MAHVLVTGGAGFIGSALSARLLESGHKLRILDCLSPQIHGPAATPPAWIADAGVEFLQGSVEDRGAFERALEDVEIVVHLAAETGTGQSMYEIARYNGVNSQGAANLLDIVASQTHRTLQRVILTSSRSIYGEGAYARVDGARVTPPARSARQLAERIWEPLDEVTGEVLRAVPTRESDPPRPASIYAATKYAQEDLVRIGCEAFGIGYAILRLQNVYGEGQSLNNPYTGILSIFSTRIRRGITLPLFEDGEESRDFVHVEDVVGAISACIETPEAPDAVVNVGSGVATSVRSVAESLSRAFGRQADLVITGEYRLGDIRHNWADISQLRERLGYEPRIDLDTGLRRFADWVSAQPLPEDLLDKANNELKARNLMRA